MACHLFDTKPLSAGLFTVGPKEQTSGKFSSKCKTFHCWTCIWKYYLQNIAAILSWGLLAKCHRFWHCIICQNNHDQIVIMSVSRETCGQRFGVFIITTMLLPCNWPQGLWIIHLLTTEYEAALLSRESDWQILWYSQCHVDSTFKLVLQNFLLNICRFQSILDIAPRTQNCDHNSYFMYWKCLYDLNICRYRKT